MHTSSPRVLILDLSRHYGGSSSRILALIRNSPSGSIALAGLENGAVTRQARAEGLPTHILAAHKADPRILPRLIRLIRSEGYQVLDTQNIQSKFWGSLAACRSQLALVSTLNSWYADEHGSSLKGLLYKTIELRTNRCLSRYIVVSQRDRRSLLRSGVPAERIDLIYNAVDIRPDSISADPQWLRAMLGMPQDSILCLAVGRLVPVKGYDVLVQAMCRIASQAPLLACILIGSGPQEPALRRQIREAGLEERLRLAGYREREFVLKALKSADLFVMPSRYEGTPIALLEAAALGLPILATHRGGIPELVTHGVHAHLVPAENPEALAAGLLRLSTDRPYASSLARAARERVRREFNLTTQVQATWRAYHLAWQDHLARRNARALTGKA